MFCRDVSDYLGSCRFGVAERCLLTARYNFDLYSLSRFIFTLNIDKNYMNPLHNMISFTVPQNKLY